MKTSTPDAYSDFFQADASSLASFSGKAFRGIVVNVTGPAVGDLIYISYTTQSGDTAIIAVHTTRYTAGSNKQVNVLMDVSGVEITNITYDGTVPYEGNISITLLM